MHHRHWCKITGLWASTQTIGLVSVGRENYKANIDTCPLGSSTSVLDGLAVVVALQVEGEILMSPMAVLAVIIIQSYTFILLLTRRCAYPPMHIVAAVSLLCPTHAMESAALYLAVPSAISAPD